MAAWIAFSLLAALVAVPVLILLFVARGDDDFERRLRRLEYGPLVRHIFYG